MGEGGGVDPPPTVCTITVQYCSNTCMLLDVRWLLSTCIEHFIITCTCCVHLHVRVHVHVHVHIFFNKCVHVDAASVYAH